MFAPTLFIGAMLGAAVGTVERLFFPNLTGSVGTYALVGMGVLFAGFLRAPITSVFMALEVSGDYSIILPVLVANLFSYFMSRRLQPMPVLEAITRQDGLLLPAMEEEREEESLNVEDAMRVRSGIVVDGTQSAADLWPLVGHTAEPHFLVRLSNQPPALITFGELQQLVEAGETRALRETKALTSVPYLHPDEPLEDALPLATRYPLIPVVNRADFSQILGVLDLPEVMEAYRQLHTEFPAPH